MPTYTMKNLETEEVNDVILSFSERDEMLASGKYEQMLATPKLVSSVQSTLSRTSGDWKNLMTKIKKGSGRGNTVND
jgi:hypothetical protein